MTRNALREEKAGRDPDFLTIAKAAQLIQSGDLSPVELTEKLLRDIETFNPQLSAFITVTADLALAQARRAEKEIMAGRYRGPMHGVPFGLKDVYDTAGILTSGHSKLCINRYPAQNATATEKLDEAGAVLVGKLATHEFAHGASFDLPWPPARNPWHLGHFTGGSSSGPAAAVASGLVLGALGTDTGGSIRTPASYCGVVGLKPTYGLVSRAGVIPNSFSFDHCGPLTWTVEDCAIMLQAIAGYDARDPASARVPVPDYRAALTSDIRGMRIGVVRHFWEEDLPAELELREAMETAIETLKDLGARVEDCRMRPVQEYYDVKMIVGETEAFCVHRKDFIERQQDYSAHYVGRVAAACLFQSVDYVRAQRQRRRLVAQMAPLYEKYDVLVTTALGPAPTLDAHRTNGFLGVWRKPIIMSVFNVIGAPAMSLCNGFNKNGLPLGMQIAGKPFDEATVLRVAYAYERATPWRTRRPHLEPCTEAPKVKHAAKVMPVSDIDTGTRQLVEMLVARAGIKLPEAILLQLCAAAPYALAMTERLADHAWEEEPANVFGFSSGT